MADFRNQAIANILGIGVVVIATSLGIFQVLKAVGAIAMYVSHLFR